MNYKVYIAGKVSKDSVFAKHHWRDEFLADLSAKSGFELENLDPLKNQKDISQNQSELIFGKDCYLISKSDFVIVNLTDDISVGGSQEMLIAKYFEKPLFGIAPKEGKFNKSEREFMGQVCKDWVDPFVESVCDQVFVSVDDLAKFLKSKKFNLSKVKKLDELIHKSTQNYVKIKGKSLKNK